MITTYHFLLFVIMRKNKRGINKFESYKIDFKKVKLKSI